MYDTEPIAKGVTSRMSTYRQLRNTLFQFYFFWQRHIVPALRDSQYVYIDRLVATVNETSVWLDLGCGHRIVPAWTNFDERTLSTKARFVVGVDCDEASLNKHEH